MYELPTVYFYGFTILLALCIGSFLNVVIARLPQMLMREWRTDCRVFLDLPKQPEQSISLASPRSHCPNCKKIIPAWHNLPLLSFFLLKRHCRHCQKPISWRYPAVELLTALLALLCAVHYGQTLPFLFAFTFVCFALCIFFIDLDHQLIPDQLSLPLIWIGLFANTFLVFTNVNIAIYSAIGAYLFLWLFIQVFYWLSGKIGMGNGDFKLFAAFGAWMGWTVLPLILLLSSFVGAVVGLIYLKLSKQGRNTPIPFGPFLVGAGMVCLLYGQEIVSWYLTLIRYL